MTIAELHRAIRNIVPNHLTIAVHAETMESTHGLNVEFKAFVHDDGCQMFCGESTQSVFEQVHARYKTATADQMSALETDLSELDHV